LGAELVPWLDGSWLDHQFGVVDDECTTDDYSDPGGDRTTSLLSAAAIACAADIPSVGTVRRAADSRSATNSDNTDDNWTQNHNEAFLV
jgi:hypothetical protein